MFQPVPDWAEHAACNGLTTRSCDPWCPDESVPRSQRKELKRIAKRICATCPVRMDCTADAVINLPKVDEHTIRGGLEPRELAQIAKDLGLPYRREAQHGTRSRYVAGCRCPECTDAHRVYEHQRRLWARRPSSEGVVA
jgi:hypothetical protein